MSGRLLVRLLLLGGGHGHLEILRRQILERRSDLVLSLVSIGPRQHYSGMVPGYLAGTYGEEGIAFDLPALVAKARGTFVEGRAAALTPAERRVTLSDGREIEYDLVSVGLGSQTRGASDPRIEESALLVKPIGKAVELRERLVALANAQGPARAVVVGAGAAGFEIACAIAAVLSEARKTIEVTLADAGPELLRGYSARVKKLADDVLRRKGITLRLGYAVESVENDAVRFASGETVPSDLTVWLTGPEAPPLLRESGLATDPRGFLLVDDALRSVSDARVFAIGDCATLASHPGTPKAGVYAVREAPVLWQSLVATLDGTPAPKYVPQSDFLSLLNTADGRAILRYGPVVSWSRWAWRLKDAIDRRFMRRYQGMTRPGSGIES